MNGKVILLIMLCINIASYVFGAFCLSSGVTCGSVNNPLVSTFVDVPNEINSNTFYTLNSTGAPKNLSSNVAGVITNYNELQPASAGSTSNPITSFIDVIKMLASFIALLTPLPLYFVLAGFGLPFFITLIFMLPIFMLYFVACAEFIGGRVF